MAMSLMSTKGIEALTRLARRSTTAPATSWTAPAARWTCRCSGRTLRPLLLARPLRFALSRVEGRPLLGALAALAFGTFGTLPIAAFALGTLGTGTA